MQNYSSCLISISLLYVPYACRPLEGPAVPCQAGAPPRGPGECTPTPGEYCQECKIDQLLHFLHIFMHLFYMFYTFYIFLCVFAYFLCIFVYIFGFSSYTIDRLMGGGRLRRTPLINYQFYMKQIQQIYTKIHKKYANTHRTI